MKLASKVAIVTGAGSGLGRASAALFAKEGARVVVVDRVKEGGLQTVKMIKDEGGEAFFYEADVSKATDCKVMLEEAVRKYGGLNILFNNAGIGKVARVEVMEERLWDEIIDVDLKSVFLCSKYAIPELKKNGGSIISMASLNGILAQRQAAAYCAAKAGVILLTRVMALELAEYNIRVNCICPGDTLTGKVLTPSDMSGEESQQVLETLRRLHPAGRLGRPDDIAKMALFLASDDIWLTGQAMIVDGGYSTQYINIYDIIELGLMSGSYEWRGKTPIGAEITSSG